MLNLECHFTRFDFLLGEKIGNGTSHHQTDQLVAAHILYRTRIDIRTIPQDSDTVSHFE